MWWVRKLIPDRNNNVYSIGKINGYQLSRLCIPVFVLVFWGPESGAGFRFWFGFRRNPVGTYPDVLAFQKAGTLVPYWNRKVFRSHWTGIWLTFMLRSWYSPYQRSKNFHSALTTHTNHCSLIYHRNNGKD
jgi:hypothetical protein